MWTWVWPKKKGNSIRCRCEWTNPLVLLMESLNQADLIAVLGRRWMSDNVHVCIWGKDCETPFPSLTAESSPLAFSPLTPPLYMGRERSHLTAEYTLSQPLSLSLSHTFAPAPQCPFLNFSPSLHYLTLSISHFHALNLSYGSAPFHLLSVSLPFILPFSLCDSDNPVLFFCFDSILAFCSCSFLPLLCHSGPFLSFPPLSHLDEQRHTMCMPLPSLSFSSSISCFWSMALLCFVLYRNDGTSRAICPWLAELCV